MSVKWLLLEILTKNGKILHVGWINIALFNNDVRSAAMSCTWKMRFAPDLQSRSELLSVSFHCKVRQAHWITQRQCSKQAREPTRLPWFRLGHLRHNNMGINYYFCRDKQSVCLWLPLAIIDLSGNWSDHILTLSSLVCWILLFHVFFF